MHVPPVGVQRATCRLPPTRLQPTRPSTQQRPQLGAKLLDGKHAHPPAPTNPPTTPTAQPPSSSADVRRTDDQFLDGKHAGLLVLKLGDATDHGQVGGLSSARFVCVDVFFG